MHSIYYKTIFISLLLGACAQAPVAPTTGSQQAPRVAAETSPEVSPLPNVALDERMLYEFLLGDIALQRGRPELAMQAYADLAKITRDPRVARRAAQLAFESRHMDKAIDAFAFWQELEPKATLPNQMLVSLLLSGGKLSEATPHVQRWLAKESKNVGPVFVQIHALLARASSKAIAFDWISKLAEPYPKVAEAHWVVAQFALDASKKELAKSEAQRAVELRPEWDAAVMLEAQLLMSTDAKLGLEKLLTYLQAYPANNEVRLYYARALLEQKFYVESRAQFQQLFEINRGNVELAFAVALLSLQMGELDRAEKEFESMLVQGKKDAGTIHYYLGQLKETRKDDAGALAEYQQVLQGEYVFAARLREAYLLGKEAKIKEARAILKSAPVTNNRQRVTVTIVEAQLLREAKQYETSYLVLLGALDALPSDPQLLFEAAITADKLGKVDAFEQTLRKLLQVAPEHAQAYNALGYSLLDRNVRLEEGMRLVEKAYQLEPNDAAITDSVGWGYYRLGRMDKSAELL
ncbi:MAG: tetratricopeptide repeat protein, partial [Gallionellaceae bacterium]|nr:tetratricopeptide repeat protein [Gallionellaceae bacterium]